MIKQVNPVNVIKVYRIVILNDVCSKLFKPYSSMD